MPTYKLMCNLLHENGLPLSFKLRKYSLFINTVMSIAKKLFRSKLMGIALIAFTYKLMAIA